MVPAGTETSPRAPRVADVLARRLARAGIRHAFGIPGAEVLSLIDALGAAGIEFVTARHETGAGLMAQGAAAASGAPGLLILTVGPGVSNSVNAIANAHLYRVPLIVVSGMVEQSYPGSYTHQVFDQRALLRPLVKASFLAQAGAIEAIAAQALELACSHPRGPVHIELPMQLAGQPIVASSPPELAAQAKAIPDLRAVSESLCRAERPLILAGLEAVSEGTAAALSKFTRAAAIPVLTTYKAKGVLDEEDALCVGAIGLSPKADAVAMPLLKAADLVLLVGYDPVEMRAAYAQPFGAGARVVELACAARDHAVHQANEVHVGALDALLRDLTAHVAARGRELPRATWPCRRPARVRDQLRESFSPARAPGFSPLAVADVLARNLPRDAYVTLDTGAHRIVLSQLLRARWAGQIQQSNGLCTMGFALPCAIGLALGSRRRVLALMGDGGFDMLAGELATLRDLALPVTCVVFDDSSLALIDLKQQAAGLTRSGVWLGATDHAAVARAFGGRGERVLDVAALERALRAALRETSGFSVIACALERGAYAGLI